MSAAVDLSEQAGALGLPWLEPEAVPMSADWECSGCGLLPGVEVIACSCGRVTAAAGAVTSDVTTVTVVGGHVAVRRAR